MFHVCFPVLANGLKSIIDRSCHIPSCHKLSYRIKLCTLGLLCINPNNVWCSREARCARLLILVSRSVCFWGYLWNNGPPLETTKTGWPYMLTRWAPSHSPASALTGGWQVVTPETQRIVIRGASGRLFFSSNMTSWTVMLECRSFFFSPSLFSQRCT